MGSILGPARRASDAKVRLIWTEPALQDLRELRAFVAQTSPQAATRQLDLLLAGAARLLEFPEMGRPGRRQGTRELTVGRTSCPTDAVAST